MKSIKEFHAIQYVTAICYRSLNTLAEVEEPEEKGESLGTGTRCHRSILPPVVKYVPGRGCFNKYFPTGPSLSLLIVTGTFLTLQRPPLN